MENEVLNPWQVEQLRNESMTGSSGDSPTLEQSTSQKLPIDPDVTEQQMSTVREGVSEELREDLTHDMLLRWDVQDQDRKSEHLLSTLCSMWLGMFVCGIQVNLHC
jgi:hypothetical protein